MVNVNYQSITILTLITLVMGMICPNSWALNETEFKVIGISSDGQTIGTVETWEEDGSGEMVCAVALYGPLSESPQAKEQLSLPPGEEVGRSYEAQEKLFLKKCQAFQREFRVRHQLSPTSFRTIALNPHPISIRNAEGRLKTGIDLMEHYPSSQQYSFSTAPEHTYSVSIESSSTPNAWQTISAFLEAPDQGALGANPSYRIRISELDHTIYSATGHYTLDNMTALVSPSHVLYSTNASPVIVVLREYKKGFEGLDYSYRPIWFVPKVSHPHGP